MRCFLAIELPEGIKEKVFALEKELPKTGVKGVAKENLHITLKFLGEVEPESIISKLSSLQHEQIDIIVKGVSAFPNTSFVRVIWVAAYGDITPLVRKIEQKLSLPAESYVPHITIARVKRKLPLQDFFQKHKNELFGSFTAKSFALFKSTLTRDGPIYEKLWEKALL